MSFKKAISALLAIILIVCALPLSSLTTSAAATSGTTGDCRWSYSNHTLTISGKGAMADYTSGLSLLGQAV